MGHESKNGHIGMVLLLLTRLEIKMNPGWYVIE